LCEESSDDDSDSTGNIVSESPHDDVGNMNNRSPNRYARRLSEADTIEIHRKLSTISLDSNTEYFDANEGA
jgi:hypothetical protein